MAKPKARNETTPHDVDHHPWDRRDGETSAAYVAFQSYMEIGPSRSLKAAYIAEYRQSTNRVPKSAPSGRWRSWSSHHSWPARAAAWDGHLARMAREGFAETLRDLGARSATETMANYYSALEDANFVASTIVSGLKSRQRGAKRLNFLYYDLKKDAAALKYAAQVLGLVNRDLFAMLGGPALDRKVDAAVDRSVSDIARLRIAPERVAQELAKIAEPAPDIAGLLPAESKAVARRAVAQLKSIEQRWDGK